MTPSPLPLSLHDCVGLLETSSVARGIAAADAMVKEAAVRVLSSRPIQPGRYATLVDGMVDEVRKALDRGSERAGDAWVDELWLPSVHPDVLPAAFDPGDLAVEESLGILEASSISATLRAADRAAKTSRARVVFVRLADGLGGKGYFLVTGAIDDVEASIDAAAELVSASGGLVSRVVLPRLHGDIEPFLRTGDGRPEGLPGLSSPSGR